MSTKTKFRFAIKDICVFTNTGSSGVQSNDGKRCRITALKDPKKAPWRGLLDEPGYTIEFLDGSNSFGCRESELEQTT